MKSKPTRSRIVLKSWHWLWFTPLVVIALLSSFYIWNKTRLTSEEQELVGTWESVTWYDSDTVIYRRWQLFNDHTLTLTNDTTCSKTPTQNASREVITYRNNTWYFRSGRLILEQPHSYKEKLQVELDKMQQRFNNVFRGQNRIVNDPYGSIGRLSSLQPDHIIIKWYDPSSSSADDSEPIIFTRVE